jgi:sugar lactone lactonase YvrE
MKRFLSIALVGTLAACGGGGSTVVPNGSQSGGSPASHARSSATFTLKVPARSASAAGRRSPQYVSPSTESLVVTLTSQDGVAVSTPQPYAANIVSSACPPVSGSPTCTLAVPASVGSDTFTVATYDATQTSANPTTLAGNLLSTASVTTTVVSGAANTVSLTLSGVVASVALALSNAAPPTGTMATIGLTVTARDADNDVIVGPGTYETPITLADSDSSGATTLSTTSVTSPSTSVTLTYDGNPAIATITATAPSVSAASATLRSSISKIWVVSSTGSVHSFTAAGAASTPTITSGLNGPYACAIDASGNLYVANLSANNVTKYSPSGALLLTISGSMSGPEGVAVDAAGKIYVANQFSNSITTYTASGARTTPTITAGISAPYGVAVDATGNIYVANTNQSNVLIFGSSGALEQTITTGISYPEGLAVDVSGKIYVSNAGNNTLTTYTPNGVQTTPTISSGLSSPRGIAVDFQGNIYLANSNHNEVSIYSSTGAPVSTISENNAYGVALY